MRGLLLFLLLGAIAVAVALFARINVGYVLFVAPPYRLELSLNAFLLLAVAAFGLGYAVARFAARLARLPAEVRAHRKAQQIARARAKQDAALVGLLEGRFGRARASPRRRSRFRTPRGSRRSSRRGPRWRRASSTWPRDSCRGPTPRRHCWRCRG